MLSALSSFSPSYRARQKRDAGKKIALKGAREQMKTERDKRQTHSRKPKTLPPGEQQEKKNPKSQIGSLLPSFTPARTKKSQLRKRCPCVSLAVERPVTVPQPQGTSSVGEGPGEVPQYGNVSGVFNLRNCSVRLRRRPDAQRCTARARHMHDKYMTHVWQMHDTCMASAWHGDDNGMPHA